MGPTDAAIVLLGDYVDKGPSSRGVLEFVRALETAFPRNIVAMMGNHDLFALLDVTMREGADRPMGMPVSEYAFAFPHPQQYVEAGWSPARDDDAELLAALLMGFQSVYAAGSEKSVALVTDHARLKFHHARGNTDLFQTVAPFRDNAVLAERVRTRLRMWQAEYAAGMVESGLAKWLMARPLVAVVGDSLVTHGGLPIQLLRRVATLAALRGQSVAQVLHAETNVAFRQAWQYLHTSNLSEPNQVDVENFVDLLSCSSRQIHTEDCVDEPLAATLVSNLVQYRGHFNGETGCKEVAAVLALLESVGVHRIVVGHTPGDEFRELCGGTLVATDSSLSRHFRAYGNRYCPIGGESSGVGNTSIQAAAVVLRAGISLAPGCRGAHVRRCEGSIGKLTRLPPGSPTDWEPHAKRITPEGYLTSAIATPTIALEPTHDEQIDSYRSCVHVALLATVVAVGIIFLNDHSTGTIEMRGGGGGGHR